MSLAASSDPLYHLEAYDGVPSPQQFTDILARLTIQFNRTVGYLRSPFFVSYDRFAFLDRRAIAEYQIETLFVDATTGKLLDEEVNDRTGQHFLRATGPVVGRLLGSMNLSAPQEIDVIVTVLQKHHDDDGSLLPPRVLFHGPVARIVRKPMDARWRTTYVSWQGGDDQNPGTREKPLKTLDQALYLHANSGPLYRVRLEGGVSFPHAGGQGGLPQSIRFGDVHPSQAPQASRYGPIFMDSYGQERALCTRDDTWLEVSRARRIRISDLKWTTEHDRIGKVAECIGPDENGYYGVFLMGPTRFMVVTRYDDEHRVGHGAAHSWRSTQMIKYELSHWRPREMQEAGWNNISIRHESNVGNIVDMVGMGKRIDWSGHVHEFGPSRGVRIERTAANGIGISPQAGAAVVQSHGQWFYTQIPKEETREVRTRMRALGNKCKGYPLASTDHNM